MNILNNLTNIPNMYHIAGRLKSSQHFYAITQLEFSLNIHRYILSNASFGMLKKNDKN